jgi:toxin ParE1/3/4
MARIKWTPQAADDLDAIAVYIAQDSPHYASLFVLKIMAAIDRLESFPEIGRIVPSAMIRQFGNCCWATTASFTA